MILTMRCMCVGGKVKYNFGFDDADTKKSFVSQQKSGVDREFNPIFEKFFDNPVKTGDDISYIFIHPLMSIIQIIFCKI